MVHLINNHITQSTFEKFFNVYGAGIVLFLIGIIFAIVFVLIADLFTLNSLPNRIFLKISEGSIFISTAAIVGSIYIFFNEFRNNKNLSKFDNIDQITLTDIDKTLKKRIFYELI
jgi:hypothetical protein